MTDNVLNSRKLTNNFNASVKPLIENGGKYDGKVKAIIRQQVQPWHGASTFVHSPTPIASPALKCNGEGRAIRNSARNGFQP